MLKVYVSQFLYLPQYCCPACCLVFVTVKSAKAFFTEIIRQLRMFRCWFAKTLAFLKSVYFWGTFSDEIPIRFFLETGVWFSYLIETTGLGFTSDLICSQNQYLSCFIFYKFLSETKDFTALSFFQGIFVFSPANVSSIDKFFWIL